jgi:hypothetical protein
VVLLGTAGALSSAYRVFAVRPSAAPGKQTHIVSIDTMENTPSGRRLHCRVVLSLASTRRVR